MAAGMKEYYYENMTQESRYGDGQGQGHGQGLRRGPRDGRGKGSPRSLALAAQRNELTECRIYRRMADVCGVPENCEVLRRLADQEERHYRMLRGITGEDVPVSRWRIWAYYWVTRLLGLNFGLRLMEQGETLAQTSYRELAQTYPQTGEILKEEQAHEEKLLGMINERALNYVGSIVLGLNDAIVELTGALAGLTLALRDTQLIALVAVITGFAASLSMGASEYLSTKEEEGESPLQAGSITGATYLVTVAILVAPYFFLSNHFVALAAALVFAVGIIFVFTFYTSVAKGLSFRRRFLEMAGISLGVAGINFVIASVIRRYFGIEV